MILQDTIDKERISLEESRKINHRIIFDMEIADLRAERYEYLRGAQIAMDNLKTKMIANMWAELKELRDKNVS